MGGRIERRIELGDEGEAEGFDGDTGMNEEHEGSNITKGNQLFIKKYTIVFLLRFPFYRCKERKLWRGEASRRVSYVCMVDLD